MKANFFFERKNPIYQNLLYLKEKYDIKKLQSNKHATQESPRKEERCRRQRFSLKIKVQTFLLDNKTVFEDAASRFSR